MARGSTAQRPSEFEGKLRQFLMYFLPLHEAGLLVLQDVQLEARCCDTLEEFGFREAFGWRELLALLESETPVFVFLDNPLSKELYDIITQYDARAGAVQIMDRSSTIVRAASFDPKLARLLLVTSSGALAEIERVFSLRDRVGMIERL